MTLGQGSGGRDLWGSKMTLGQKSRKGNDPRLGIWGGSKEMTLGQGSKGGTRK